MADITDIDDLADRLTEIIEDKLGGITEPIREALPGAADIYIKHAQEQTEKVLKHTPHKDEGQHMAKSWTKKQKAKYKNKIFIGNTRKFKDAKGENSVPAINIFEYGTSWGLPPKPILQPALDAAEDEIVKYIVEQIESNL